MRVRRKILLLTVVTVLISGFLATTVYASWANKIITAHYRNVKINHNGEPVNIEKGYEPFIVHINGDPNKASTFVPVRFLGEILGKEVKWDQSTYTVDILDKDEGISEDVADLMYQLILKDNEIDKLKRTIEELETKLKEVEKGNISSKDLKKTEGYLRRNYNYYKDMDFDIKLYKYKNEIQAVLIVDLDKYYNQWDRLRNWEIEDYVEDIVKKIQYDFKGVKVSGEIEDKRTGDILVKFYTDSRDRVIVNIDVGSRYIRNLDDMEYYLNRDFARDYSWHRSLDFEIGIIKASTERNIELIVDVDKTDWNNLSISTQDDFLMDIYDAIIREFPRASIDGCLYYFNEGKIIHEFKFDSKGNVTVN